MAGLFGTFESPDIVEARRRAEIDQQLQAQRQQQLAGLQAGTQGSDRLATTLGFGLGSAAAGLFGNQLDDKLATDPELMASRQQRQMLQGISEVQAAPGTSDFFAQAALKVQDQNPAMALELGMRAQQARASEQKAAAAEKAAVTDAARKDWNALPTETQQLAIMEDPTIVNRVGGQNMTEEELLGMQENAKAMFETKRLVEAKKAADVKGAKTPTTNQRDVDVLGKELEKDGYGGHTFEKSFGRDDKESFELMVQGGAEWVNQFRSGQAQQGVNITPADARQIYKQVINGFTTRNGPDDATAVDIPGMQKTLQALLNAGPAPQPAVEAPQAPASTVEEEFDIDLTVQ